MKPNIAWAAGLFEGEGSILIDRHKGRVRLRLQLVMSDADVVDNFAAFVGFGHVQRGRQHWMTKTPMFRWLGSGEHAYQLLRQLKPYFGNRRKFRANEAMAAHRQYRNGGSRRGYIKTANNNTQTNNERKPNEIE